MEIKRAPVVVALPLTVRLASVKPAVIRFLMLVIEVGVFRANGMVLFSSLWGCAFSLGFHVFPLELGSGVLSLLHASD